MLSLLALKLWSFHAVRRKLLKLFHMGNFEASVTRSRMQSRSERTRMLPATIALSHMYGNVSLAGPQTKFNYLFHPEFGRTQGASALRGRFLPTQCIRSRRCFEWRKFVIHYICVCICICVCSCVRDIAAQGHYCLFPECHHHEPHLRPTHRHASRRPR
jgi:hypothetical protein